ncbi:MAG TPA: hypothetical protein VJZ03_06615 [Candidatus Bathyarchaeia archaeon]|nr:hypothetical protein [Candidatus Bathyarchaeia archaeon]
MPNKIIRNIIAINSDTDSVKTFLIQYITNENRTHISKRRTNDDE